MILREYDPARDRAAVHRIYREIGWLRAGKEEVADAVIEAGRAMVAEVDGSAESLVLSSRGLMRYLDEDLPFAGLTGVSTSLVGRKQGLARRLTALTLALDAAEGVAVHGLGMFDQGFYNRLGYGTGSYEHHISFDPAALTVPPAGRPPRRLSKEDWQTMHEARLTRCRFHGGINLRHPGNTRHEVLESDKGFGLGYYDGANGGLSHYFWCEPEKVEHGPYHVRWLVYREPEQLLELLGVLKTLGDQVHAVTMQEPFGIQMQDLISQPFKQSRITRGTPYQAGINAAAWWQVRICDLEACLEHTHLQDGPLRFNLALSDPIEAHLADDAPWRGIGGDYIVELGPTSGAEPGHNPTLPALQATVNAFSRMWLGVRSASGLAVTDCLRGEPNLLRELDGLLCLPRPSFDWDF